MNLIKDTMFATIPGETIKAIALLNNYGYIVGSISLTGLDLSKVEIIEVPSSKDPYYLKYDGHFGVFFSKYEPIK